MNKYIVNQIFHNSDNFIIGEFVIRFLNDLEQSVSYYYLKQGFDTYVFLFFFKIQHGIKRKIDVFFSC